MANKFKYVLMTSWEEMKTLKMDGISNAARSKYVTLVLFWLVAFGACCSFCVWLVVSTFEQYYAYRVTTTIRKYSEQTYVVFPTVTMCNMNPFSTAYAVQLLEETGQLDFVRYMSTGTLGEYAQVFANMQAHLNATRGYLLTSDELQQMGNLEHMQFSCNFNQQICNATFFEFMHHPTYFICYRFNPRGDLIVLQEGDASQLNVEMYVGLPNQINSYYRGLYVFVQNASNYPFDDMSPTPIRVTPGIGVRIVADRFFNAKYPHPYSECTVQEDGSLVLPLADASLFELAAATNYSYTQNTCIKYCLQQLFVEQCGCYSLTIKENLIDVDNTSACLTSAQRECISDKYTALMSGTLIGEYCLPKCPLECSTSEIVTSNSFYTYPFTSAYVSNILMTNPYLNTYYSDQNDYVYNLAGNVVRFEVLYESLTYTRIEEENKMSGEDLLGVLGGHLHLFLGMSLLSFVEIIELIFIVLRHVVVSEPNKTSGVVVVEASTPDHTQTRKSMTPIEIKVQHDRPASHKIDS